jgi:hypothetical protein
LGGPRLEIVEIFQGHLEYFTDIWDISWPSGTFCVHLVLFPGFGIMYQEQSGNPVDEERKKILSRKSFFLSVVSQCDQVGLNFDIRAGLPDFSW